MHIIQDNYFVTILWFALLKRILAAKSLSLLQIVAGDAWRVKFLEFDIIPDGLPVAPKYPLQVHFAQKHAVELGNVLLPSQTVSAPVFINTTADFGFHVILMTDLDYPSPTSRGRREYLHWMVSNINHAHLSDGDELAEYVSPSKSGHHGGTHRYMLTFFRQQEGVNLDFIELVISKDEVKDPERTSFCTKTFMKQYNLSLPLAANFFTIKWPENSDLMFEEYAKQSRQNRI